MKILRKYIGRSVFEYIFIVTLVLMGLEIFISVVAERGNIGQGSYGTWQAVVFILYRAPLRLYQLFPMSGLLGALVGLGFLGARSELIVMRAAGVSLAQLIGAVMRVAFVLVIFVTLLGMFIAPVSEHHGMMNKAMEMSGGQAIRTQGGTWIRHADSFVYIRQMLPGNILSDITIYNFDGHHRLLTEQYAKTATPSNNQWILHDVTESHISEKEVTVTKAKQQVWNVQLNPNLLKVAETEPDQMAMTQLYPYVKYLKRNGLESASYELEFWQRIFQPLATAVMVLLAIPFIFGPLRSVSMSLRILVGVVVGFSFYIVNMFFGPLSIVMQLPPFLGASLPTIIFGVLGLLLMLRVR